MRASLGPKRAKLELDEFGDVKMEVWRLILVVIILGCPLTLSSLSSSVFGVFMVEGRVGRCNDLKAYCCWWFCYRIKK